MGTQNRRQGPPSRFDLFTGGATKTAEMAIFYNIAHKKVFAIIDHWQKQVANIDTERSAGDRFADSYKNLLRAFHTMNYNSSGSEPDFAEAVYAKLRNYLWKGYETDKNKSGYTIDETDKRIIRKLLVKLRDIRNYHSHIWHSNHMIEFDKELKDFIVDKHDSVLRKLTETEKQDVEYYLENYAEHPLFKNGHYITPEGRTFLLSFFLSSGEMNRFLGKRRGSKRNDELRYRVKQKIYRYYTHRDGATRNIYSMEEGMMEGMTDTEVNEINFARQTYKIISYLNDLPDTANAPSLYPLHFEDKKVVGETVAAARPSTAAELIEFCRENNLLAELEFGTETFVPKESEDDESEQEPVEKEGVVLLKYIGAGEHTFRVGAGTFHRLIIDCLRLGKHEAKTGEQWIKDRLVSFGIERNRLIEILEKPEAVTNGEQADKREKELNEYLLYRHRGALKMRKKMSNWHFAYTTGKATEGKHRTNLVEASRELPVELRYYDFYFEADEKPRKDDRFTEFAVKYLMDYEVTPGWKWQVEKFEVVPVYDKKENKTKLVNKNIKEFHTRTPDGWRLNLNEGQVVVGIGEKTVARTGEEPRTVPEYTFQLGHRALKNLLIAHLAGGKDITPFLQTVAGELKNIANNMATGTGAWPALFKENQLPRYLKLGVNNKAAQKTEFGYNNKLKKRIDYVRDELKEALETPQRYSRNKKNEIIMQCYQFYNWQYKFLRKNEYEQMGVFHYTLDRDNRKHLDFLLEDFKARIPKQVKVLIGRSKNIDALFENTVKAAIDLLNVWKGQVSNNNQDKIKDVAQKLGVPKQASPPTAEKKGQWLESFSLLPFSIHPALVQQVLYATEWKAASGDFSLSDKIRKNPLFTLGLREKDGYYSNDAYTELMAGNGSRAAMKNAIGKINEQLTEDALLWKIARKYLERVNPEIQKIIRAKGALKVENLSKTVVEQKLENSSLGPVKVKLFFHQLDDLLMVQKKDVLTNAAHYYLNALSPEKREAKRGADKTFVIEYEEIRQQMVRVYELSHDIIHHLFDWEKQIIRKQKEADLPDTYVDFPTVCQMAALSKEQTKDLNDLRKYAIHTEIPAGWNYAEKVAAGTWIRKLIGYTERIKYDYTIPPPDKAES